MAEIDLKPLPPEEAIAYFRRKGFETSWRWQDMWHEDHARAFTVAKAMRIDILRDIRGEMDRAIAEGTTLDEFRNNLTPILQRKGWWGKQEIGGETVQLGSPRRLRTIFNVNIQTAYSVGHYRQMTDPDVLRARPFWRYVAVNDTRTRPAHRSWHGTVLPADHPWWDTHFPPNGWNCRCRTVSLSAREMKRDGLKVTDDPDTRMEVKTDPRTGDAALFPAGIDPGWDYNPGKAYLNWDREGRKAAAAGAPIRPTPGQKTWKDYGRPDLRRVEEALRTPAPELLPEADGIEAAIGLVADAVGMAEDMGWVGIRTRDEDLAIIHRDLVRHLVEKRVEARERYANFIRPTLTDPFEIYLTDYDGELRKTYIGLFAGRNDLFVVARLNLDGSLQLVWNIMGAGDKRMNAHRVGTLIYGK